jgi:hypothetical protein
MQKLTSILKIRKKLKLKQTKGTNSSDTMKRSIVKLNKYQKERVRMIQIISTSVEARKEKLMRG